MAARKHGQCTDFRHSVWSCHGLVHICLFYWHIVFIYACSQGSHSPGKSGNSFCQGKSGNFVVGQGILVACDCERKWRFLSMFQGKVACQFVIFFMILCLFTLSGLKCGNDSTGSRCRGGGAD